MRKREISSEKGIEMFLHCGQCLKEKPDDISPSTWAKLEVGWTLIGLQVWCKRHNLNVLHVDFEGAKHPANLYGIAGTKTS